jgi:hypothetical protein
MSSESEKNLTRRPVIMKNQENTNIDELVTAERKAYYKAWREANKNRTAEHRRRYWEKRALKRLTEQERGEAND